MNETTKLCIFRIHVDSIHANKKSNLTNSRTVISLVLSADRIQ